MDYVTFTKNLLIVADGVGSSGSGETVKHFSKKLCDNVLEYY